jgi:hypothetical protein
VPPNQTEVTVETLRRNGNAVGYLLLTGEQRGFRQAANIKRSLDDELTVYAVEVVPVTLMSLVPAVPFWLGEIERLLEAHGVSLRLPTRTKRFPLNLVQPLLVVKQRHVGII